MVVVDQVLIIGVGVNGLHVTVNNTEFVIYRLQNRRDGIGSTRRRRQDRIISADHVIVNAVYDIFQITFGGRCQ